MTLPTRFKEAKQYRQENYPYDGKCTSELRQQSIRKYFYGQQISDLERHCAECDAHNTQCAYYQKKG